MNGYKFLMYFSTIFFTFLRTEIFEKTLKYTLSAEFLLEREIFGSLSSLWCDRSKMKFPIINFRLLLRILENLKYLRFSLCFLQWSISSKYYISLHLKSCKSFLFEKVLYLEFLCTNKSGFDGLSIAKWNFTQW